MNKPLKKLALISMLAGALAGVQAQAWADEKTMPRPEMMQESQKDEGAYPMRGYGYGYGMGMMAGVCPMGMGMMGGGMGPGYGMGPGMMGGWGGGMGPLAMLDLSKAQTELLEKIQTESLNKQRPLMRQMWDEQGKQWDLLNAEKRDPAAIGKAYARLANLQRQMLETCVDAENKMAGLLTKEQKAQIRRGFGHGMMGY